MATVSERSGRVDATQDENADGVIDRRDDEIAADRLAPSVPEPAASGVYRSTYPAAPVLADPVAAPVVAAPVAAPVATEPVATEPVTAEPTFTRDDSEVIAPIGPRPRASGMATLSLIVGVLAGVAVITGQLAGVGIGLGILAALFAFGGISATGRRHVAGKTDALFGLLLGLASIAFGVLMVTNSLSWLSVDTNLLTNLHTWLQSHASWLLPS